MGIGSTKDTKQIIVIVILIVIVIENETTDNADERRWD